MLLILASIGKPDIVPAGCAVMFQASQCGNTISCFPCHLNAGAYQAKGMGGATPQVLVEQKIWPGKYVWSVNLLKLVGPMVGKM